MIIYKKIPSVILIVFLLAACAVPVFANEIELQNTGDSWSADAIRYVSENKIMTGRDTGFAAKSEVTRAEAAVVASRMFDLTAKGDLSQYTDVESDAWYYDSMRGAVEAGIMNGYNNQLRPSDSVSREEMVTIFGRILVSKNVVKNFSAFTDLKSEYNDDDQISDWAAKYVDLMTDMGCVKGTTDNVFNPKASLSREELAQIIYNMDSVIFSGQTEMLNLPESAVTSIKIGSGNTGQTVELTDTDDIIMLIDAINNLTVVRKGYSEITSGFGYTIDIKYTDSENCNITVSSDGSIIQKGPYTYEISSGMIDMSMITNMLNK